MLTWAVAGRALKPLSILASSSSNWVRVISVSSLSSFKGLAACELISDLTSPPNLFDPYLLHHETIHEGMQELKADGEHMPYNAG